MLGSMSTPTCESGEISLLPFVELLELSADLPNLALGLADVVFGREAFRHRTTDISDRLAHLFPDTLSGPLEGLLTLNAVVPDLCFRLGDPKEIRG